MSTITQQADASSRPIQEPWVHHRFSVEQYREMGRLGILGPDDRVELLEGWIVKKVNLNPPHAVSLGLCEQVIRSAVSKGLHCRNQLPVTTGDSEPEPDLALVRGDIRDFGQRHPTSQETPLVIEVADSSLEKDRYKRAIYGRAGFPCYWIVNLKQQVVEVYTEPTGSTEKAGYGKQQEYKPGQQVPLLNEGNEIAKIEVKDLLP